MKKKIYQKLNRGKSRGFNCFRSVLRELKSFLKAIAFTNTQNAPGEL